MLVRSEQYLGEDWNRPRRFRVALPGNHVEGRTFMLDYCDPNDPQWRARNFNSDGRSMNATLGWIATATCIVMILGITFGIGPDRIGTNTAGLLEGAACIVVMLAITIGIGLGRIGTNTAFDEALQPENSDCATRRFTRSERQLDDLR